MKRFRAAPEDVQAYFKHVPKLAEEFPLSVCIVYMFSRLELAHRRALYCGVVKLHRADSRIADRVVDGQDVDRGNFKVLFKTVFEKELPKRLQSQIEEAEQVRDEIVPGKRVSAADKRKAVVDGVAYATGFNKFVEALTGARPFGDLRGFKGRAQGLEKSTTRWLLKGMGFEVA